MTYYMCFIRTLTMRFTVYELQPLQVLRHLKHANRNIIYDFIHVFHANLGHSITVSEILAQIDHIGLNWTYLNLKIKKK